ncbi:YciI family protein [Brevundimonas aurifodinae]|uniref:YciI family protein n=1 Tax=Brevundimonas aurifodinae TaxID=1508312 RepID=A0ABV1NL10_9CAUL
MKYMFLLYGNEAAFGSMTEDQRNQAFGAYMAYNSALQAEGVMVSGDPLQPSFTASRVRAPDGKTEILNGPYADTQEQLGGTYVIDVPDLDAALAWAARCPMSAWGTVEVRPLMVLG